MFRYGFLSSLDNTRRSEQSQFLYEAFKLLNDNARWKARRRCINLFGYKDKSSEVFKILKKMGANPRDNDHAQTIYLESREIVKADFERIRYLVYNGLINEEHFLNIYWRVGRYWNRI